MSDKLSLKFEVGTILTPGDKIGSTRDLHPGSGTYVRSGQVYASIVGKLEIAPISPQSQIPLPPSTKSADSRSENPKYTVTICMGRNRKPALNQILSVGEIVLGKVKKITLQGAITEIVSGERVGTLHEHFAGIIRKENIRTGGTEELQIHECFLPNDIVMARIISLGDSRRYFLSTMDNQLGVVSAVSRTSGRLMVPISSNEMICPETKVKELRKCAESHGGG